MIKIFFEFLFEFESWCLVGLEPEDASNPPEADESSLGRSKSN